MKAALLRTCGAIALSLGLTAVAHADQMVPVTLSPVGTSTTQTGGFSDTFASAGSFVDDYIFSGAPTEGLLQFLAASTSSVSFSSVTLSYAFGGDTIDFSSASLTPSAITASLANAGSGLYDLEISGTALAAGASYVGSISEQVGAVATPVPEPSAAALMLAGLMATAGLVRRRRAA